MPKTIKNKFSKKIVPYKRGFKRATESRQRAALGWSNTESIVPEFRPDTEFFQSIPECTTIDDWLAQYNESGQTYKNFLVQCPWFPRRIRDRSILSTRFPNKAIYMVQVGDFQSENSPDFTALVDYARIFLGLPVRTLTPIGIERKNGRVDWVMQDEDGDRTVKNRIKCRFDKSSRHYQLNVEAVLDLLKKLKPDSAFCLIALTMADLYEAPRDLFVAGMASGKQYVAIFSLFRYDPHRKFSTEFWYGIETNERTCKQKKRSELILQRSCRLLVHEIAHLLGIDHCIFYACCMNGSGHLAEDFSQPMHLCPIDLRKLQTLVGFDVCHRYNQLQTFYETYGMSEEASWICKRLAFITKQSCIDQNEVVVRGDQELAIKIT